MHFFWMRTDLGLLIYTADINPAELVLGTDGFEVGLILKLVNLCERGIDP
jgi:hypothetical protein